MFSNRAALGRAAVVIGLAIGVALPGEAVALPVRERELTASGGWSWFGDPRAVYHQGAHRRTYVGWVDTAGNIQVASYDHDTRVRTVATLKARFQIDDHDTPSLLVRPDGRLIAFWSAHAGQQMFYRRSTRPEDVTAWGPERTVPTNTAGSFGYTYPNPVQLSAEGDRIWLFWRGGNFNPTFATSSDEVTWAPARTLISMPRHRPYLKVAGNGVDTIHFAFTEAHPRNLQTSIYYAAYRAGNLRRANGALIEPVGQLPITPGQADVVYRASAHGGVKAWVHDVAFDAAGRPVIVFATFPSDTDHRYHYARWDGTRWIDREFTRAGGRMSGDPGEPNYSGGVTLDHENPSQVYVSRQVGRVFEVEVWSTPNGGASWTRRPVTTGSARGNYRPISPRGQTGADLNVVWMHGDYPSYVGFRTGLEVEAASHDVTFPAAVDLGVGRLAVAASDAAGGLLHKSYASGWSPWRELGRGPAGHTLGRPAVASAAAGQLDLFAVDNITGHLLHRRLVNGSWSGWSDLGAGPGGHAVVAPAAVSQQPGRLDVVARDTVTHDLLHWAFAGSWTAARRLTGTPGGAYAPALASWGPGRLDVFAITNQGRLAHAFNTGGWRWEALGAGPGGVSYIAPAAVTAWGHRRLDVFAPTSAGTLAHRWFAGGTGAAGWRGPETLTSGTGPDRHRLAGMAAASWAPRRLDVFSTNARTHGLLHTWFAGSWLGPEHLDFGGPPTAVLADPNPRSTPIPVDPRIVELGDD